MIYIVLLMNYIRITNVFLACKNVKLSVAVKVDAGYLRHTFPLEAKMYKSSGKQSPAYSFNSSVLFFISQGSSPRKDG